MRPIDWLLGHLDEPGVLEIVLGVGRPAAVRTADGFRPITSMNFERTEIETLVAGTPLSGLIGSPTSLPATEIEIDARRLIVEVVRQGYNAALRIARVGAPASETPAPRATPTTVPPRTMTPTAAPRTMTPTAAPRTMTPTASPRTVPQSVEPLDEKPIVSVRMTSPSTAPRTATTTVTPRTTTPASTPPANAPTSAPRTATTTGMPRTVTPASTPPSNASSDDMPVVRMTSPTSAPRTTTTTTTTPPRTVTPATTPPRAVTPMADEAPIVRMGGATVPPRTATPASTPPPPATPPEPTPSAAMSPRTTSKSSPPLTVSPLSTRTMPRITTEPTFLPNPAPQDDVIFDHKPVEGIDHSFATALGGGGEIVDADAEQQFGTPEYAPTPEQDWYGPQIIDERTDIAAVHALLEASYRRNASDLHIIANQRVTIRRLGELTPLDAKSLPAPVDRAVFSALLGPIDATAGERFLMPLLGPSAQQRLAEVGYVDLGFNVPGRGRVRANISQQQDGLAGSFRLCRDTIPTLDSLGLPHDLEKTVRHHQGLVVIAGPSGAGKTTTMAALVDLLNTSNSDHIITIEDPVEIEHPAKRAIVSHREVGRHTLSFVSALKASLREDPDVIVIGELRDRETVEIALAAAETGHLVLSTISTPSAVKTIDRLIDMFPPDDQVQVRASISGTLRAVIAQRLLPNVAREGQVVAIELVTGVLPLATMIRDNKMYQLPSLMQRGRAFGMIRLDDSLLEHVRAKRITEETALAAAENKKELAAQLAGRPTPSPTSARGLFGGKGST